MIRPSLADPTPLPADLDQMEQLDEMAQLGQLGHVELPRPGSRLARFAQPLAADVVREVAISHQVCVRPVALKVVDHATGEVQFVDVPCGATWEGLCPSCAGRAKALRMAQCREGWHLDADPLPDADPPTDPQLALAEVRAQLTRDRDAAGEVGALSAVAEAEAAITATDDALTDSGVRGSVEPGRGQARRSRSTRRRQDTPDLPKRPSNGSTLGRTFIGRGGTVYRPSMFITLTLPSYGPVHPDGTPLDPSRYDYARAARDALHFPKLLDRWFQNLRRVAGYDAQYFATLEPQRRLAPHAHIAVRGTLPRTLLAQVTAATYHQVWWPSVSEIVYPEDREPVWDDVAGGYLDPATGAVLPTWEDALDQLDQLEDPEPLHVVRFGAQVNIQGLLAGTPDADRRIGYLCKYLTKQVTACHGEAPTLRERRHVDRLVAALKFEPCSPTCANWLRYGIQPQRPRPDLHIGHCRGKAHQPTHLGLGGRRVLLSRQWSGKTLTDHRHDRRAFIAATLTHLLTDPDPVDQGDDEDTDSAGGVSADELTAEQLAQPGRLEWTLATPADELPPLATRLLHAIAEKRRWRAHYERALALARGEPDPYTSAAPDVAA
jgi:hypothetical protein